MIIRNSYMMYFQLWLTQVIICFAYLDSFIKGGYWTNQAYTACILLDFQKFMNDPEAQKI